MTLYDCLSLGDTVCLAVWLGSQFFVPGNAYVKQLYDFNVLKMSVCSPLQQVATQLWQTLYDYPCLKECDGLLKYIKSCVSLAWDLSNQVNDRE